MKNLFKVLGMHVVAFEARTCFRASVKYGAIITELKGSVGGHTFKATAGTGVMQTKINRSATGKTGGKTTKADAGRVISALKNTAQNATNWKALSASDRLAWGVAAVDFPFTNKYGQQYTPSGFQLYMSINNNLLNIGEPVISVPPTPEAWENAPAFTAGVSVSPPSQLSINTVLPAGYSAILYASSNQSTGRNYEPGRMKAIAIFDGSTVFPYNAQPDYEAVFGTMPTGGNYWLEVKITKADAGRGGNPYRVNYQN